MKKSNTFILLAVSFLFLASCTMERRLHNKGFHVQWNKKYASQKSQDTDKAIVAANDTERSVSEKELAEPQFAPVKSSRAEMESTTISRDSQIETDFVESGENSSVSETYFESVSAASNLENESFDLRESQVSMNQGNENTKRKAHNSEGGNSGKSQIIALILVIFLGLIGVHRFYLGYTGVGVFMVLTLGLFGILALIDLIRIAVGDLEPKRGEYSETL